MAGVETRQGLLDTSVFIASEVGHALDVAALPDQSAVSVVTLAELEAGVLIASDTDSRARRLLTLELAKSMHCFGIDEAAASHWARMRIRLAEEGLRVNVNDLWIAAVALANDLPVVTQDDDFDPLTKLVGLSVIRV